MWVTVGLSRPYRMQMVQWGLISASYTHQPPLIPDQFLGWQLSSSSDQCPLFRSPKSVKRETTPSWERTGKDREGGGGGGTREIISPFKEMAINLTTDKISNYICWVGRHGKCWHAHTLVYLSLSPSLSSRATLLFFHPSPVIQGRRPINPKATGEGLASLKEEGEQTLWPPPAVRRFLGNYIWERSYVGLEMAVDMALQKYRADGQKSLFFSVHHWLGCSVRARARNECAWFSFSGFVIYPNPCPSQPTSFWSLCLHKFVLMWICLG